MFRTVELSIICFVILTLQFVNSLRTFSLIGCEGDVVKFCTDSVMLGGFITYGYIDQTFGCGGLVKSPCQSNPSSFQTYNVNSSIPANTLSLDV